MDGPYPAPGGGLAGAHVGAGVSAQVGLVDGDGGDAEPGGGRHAPDAEDERAGQVDQIGTVLGDGRGDASAGEGDADLGVAGEREGGDTHDGAGRFGVRPGPRGGGGGDDEGA